MRSLLEGFQLKFISLDVKKFNFEFKTINKNNEEFQNNMYYDGFYIRVF